MRRVAPSVIARERLQALLDGGVDLAQNIVSALVRVVTSLVVQELVEAEQADFLGGRGGAGCAPGRVSSMWRCRRYEAPVGRSVRR